MSNPRPYMPQPEKLAQYVKNCLKQIGVDETIQLKEWSSYLQEIQNGSHDMCFFGWIGDTGDPDNFLYVLLDKENAVPGTASNISFYRSESVHQLLTEARVTFEPAMRDELYRQAQEQIYADVPLLPLVHNAQVILQRREIEGVLPHPTAALRFDRARFVGN